MNSLLVPFERKSSCSEAFDNLYSRARIHSFPTNTRISHILHQSVLPHCTAWRRTSLRHSLFAQPWRACPRISQRLYDRWQCGKQRKRWICRLTVADHGMDNLQTRDSHRTTYQWQAGGTPTKVGRYKWVNKRKIIGTQLDMVSDILTENQ